MYPQARLRQRKHRPLDRRFLGKTCSLDDLLLAIQNALPETAKRMKLLIPFAQAGLLARIRDEGNIFSEEYTADGIEVDALVDIKLVSACEQYQI